MRISDAIERLRKALPDIETHVLEDAIDNNERNTLLNLFQKLREGLKDENPMAIRHWMLRLSMWYKDRINKKNYYKVCHINELTGMFTKTNINPVIFLSHSSKDRKYADPLRTFISDLGVPDDQIIYTSHHKHNIPPGENIYNYLAKKIHENCLMINLWSDNYFKSLACICETGAAWVSGCAYEKLCVPPLLFNDERFIAMPMDPQKVGIVLDGSDICRKGMLELGQRIKQFFKISEDIAIEPVLNAFMAEIVKVEKERCS